MSRPLAPAAPAASAGLFVLGILFLPALVPGPAAAQPTNGFVESFTGAGNLADWDSQANRTNPGTGGAGGAGDGFLRIARTFDAQLGARNVTTTYAGNWLTAGVDRVRFSLNDVDGNQNLEIHFVIGNSGNLWQYDTGFIPPENAWAEFTVDLRDTANFTAIINFAAQTYSTALQTADRILIRHDMAPYIQSPNAITGEFGLDEIKLQQSLIGVDPAAPGPRARPVMLAPPFPNPSRGSAVFSFETFEEGPVTLAVVDARGRIVRRETLASGLAGRHAWTWDGRDAEGRLAAAGVYRVRAWSAAGGTSRTLVLTR
jgi:hypothetical protein